MFKNIQTLEEKCDFRVAIAGNPNVGKSTIFNSLTRTSPTYSETGLGKTVINTSGTISHKEKKFLLVDIPRYIFFNF